MLPLGDLVLMPVEPVVSAAPDFVVLGCVLFWCIVPEVPGDFVLVPLVPVAFGELLVCAKAAPDSARAVARAVDRNSVLISDDPFLLSG